MAFILIPAGTTRTVPVEIAAGDTLTLPGTAAVSVPTGNYAIRATVNTGPLKIDNSGTIEHTAAGAHAILLLREAFAGNAEAFLDLDNKAGALIVADGDAIRFDSAGGGSLYGRFTISNTGTIRSLGGQAVDVSAAGNISGGNTTITNYGLIASDTGDGIRANHNAEIVNRDNGRIDGGDLDDVFSPEADGIQATGYGGRITNLQNAIITGDRSGIRIDPLLDAQVQYTFNVRNEQSAQIVGRGGAGAAFGEAFGVFAKVSNYGLIQGGMTNGQGDGDGLVAYGGAIANFGIIRGTGSAAGFTNAGVAGALGGGVDVDNNIGGLISGLDAGVDAARLVENGGRIEALGGGNAAAATGVLRARLVVNEDNGTIVGLDNGIALDQSFSGPSSIVNYGTITGTNGYGIVGTAGADRIENLGAIAGGNGISLLLAGGDDFLTIGRYARFTGRIDGGTGRDTLNVTGKGVDLVGGSVGEWRATGFEAVYTGNQADTVTIGAGHFADTGDGDDTVYVTADENTEAHGGYGYNTLDFSKASGVSGIFDLSVIQFTTLDGGKFSGFSNLIGSSSSDVMYGHDGANLFAGNGGNDTIDGNGGIDTVRFRYISAVAGVTVDAGAVTSGGNGAVRDGLGFIDQLFDIEIIDFFGSAFADIAIGGGTNDTLNGWGGDDTLHGNGGANKLIGGDGNDLAVFDFAASGERAEINATEYFVYGMATYVYTSVGRNTLTEIERILFKGSAFDDTAVGGRLPEDLFGNAGNDTLNGNGGLDSLSGGEGADYLLGGGAEDTALGGVGNDTIYGEAGNDSLDGGEGVDRLYGGDANDTLQGGAGSDGDILDGGAGNDFMNGQDGHDTLTGGAGLDYLRGGEGADVLNGNDGNDTIDGFRGNDVLTGGAGGDRFTFQTSLSGADTIFDFNQAEGDRFNLSGGSFTLASESAGNTTLTHTGGTIVVRGVTGLSVAQWNGLTTEPFAPEAADLHPHTDYLA